MIQLTPKNQHAIEYIAVGALVAAAIIIGIVRFNKGDIDDDVFSRKKFNDRWKEIETLEANVPGKESGITYTVNDEGFPFKSPFDEIGEEKASGGDDILLPAMQIQGMIWKSSRPQVIINNKLYDIKDIINVAGEAIEVKDINKDGVHLMYKYKEFIARPK